MRTKFFFILLGIFSLSLHAATTPKEVVETIFENAAKPEISTDIKIQEEINKLVDFHFMAKESLGKEFQKQDEKERSWYVTTLKDIITKTVYPESADFLKQVKITYATSSVLKNDQAVIKSTVRSKGEDTDVEYKLRKEGENWRVYDISIDGESWTNNIKSQVLKSLQKDGWNGLKIKLNKRLQDLKKA